MPARKRTDPLIMFREFAELDRRRRERPLSVAELERFTECKRALDARIRKGEPSAEPDRRDSLRVPVELDVRFETRAEVRDSLITNLSRGGLFVATQHPLAIGAEIQLVLRVGRPPREIRLTGEVASRNVGPDLATPRAGMGIRFTQVDEADQEFLDSLYEDALRRASRIGEG